MSSPLLARDSLLSWGQGIGATHDALSTEEMAEVAHRHGLPLVVDAAHGRDWFAAK